jgi:hypothetical protein
MVVLVCLLVPAVRFSDVQGFNGCYNLYRPVEDKVRKKTDPRLDCDRSFQKRIQKIKKASRVDNDI